MPRPVDRPRLGALLFGALLVIACGGAPPAQIQDGDGRGSGATPDAAAPAGGGDAAAAGDSCALATPQMVADAFAATSARAEPAETIQGDPICRFRLTGGLVPNVYIWHHGSSDGWQQLLDRHSTPPLGEDRHVFEERNTIGDGSFYWRTSLLVRVGVRSDPIQYSVYVAISDIRPPVGGREIDAALIDLARAIAGS